MRIGIIDIGSNSIRLVVYEVQGTSYNVVGQVKHSARLGQDMVDGALNQRRIDYGIRVLKSFKEFMDSRNVTQVIAVATEAIRKASNKEVFLTAAKKALGKEIRVLSGEEEAFFDYYATVNTLDLNNCLMIDIGGSSTEIVLIRNRMLEESVSLPLGSITLTEKFNIRTRRENEAHLKAFVEKALSEVYWLKKARNLPIVGVGGSVRTLGRIDRFRKDYGMFIAHNYSLEEKDVAEIYDLTAAYLEGRGQRLPGLSKDREDIFIGSLAIVDLLMKELRARKLFVSGAGLRDGLLFQEILGGNKRIPDVLEFSLNNIITQHMFQGYEGKEIHALVRVLYSAVTKKYPYLLGNGKVLKTASYLYDLGTSINYFQRDRNTFYSILNAPINGLSQKQILMAASTASVFSANDILRDFYNRKMLSARDLKVIEKLGILIKLAEAINFGVSGETRIRDVDITDTTFVIHCETAKDPLFKRQELQFYGGRFKSIYGLQLDVRFHPDP